MEELLETTTDENGYFSVTKTIDPPGFWLSVGVEIWAKLIEPASVVATGTLDIDATDGSPSNQEKKFRLESGKNTSLGHWRVSLDQNIVRVHGRILPKKANATLKVNVSAKQ